MTFAIDPTKNEDRLKRVPFSMKGDLLKCHRIKRPTKKKSQTQNQKKNSHKSNRNCRRQRFIAQVKGSVVSRFIFPKVHKWVIVKESFVVCTNIHYQFERCCPWSKWLSNKDERCHDDRAPLKSNSAHWESRWRKKNTQRQLENHVHFCIYVQNVFLWWFAQLARANHIGIIVCSVKQMSLGRELIYSIVKLKLHKQMA